tara:strand:+ start:7900 stop:8361 length:462 start_codon:yes stop_codon:yes gene_type:complete
MANKNKVGIIIGVSVVLVGVTAFFIYRGIKSSKDAMAKLKEGETKEQKKDVSGSTTQTPPIADGTSTTTTTTTTDNSGTITPPPTKIFIQPKSQSILREKPSTISKKLVTFVSGVQIEVEGMVSVGGYQWLKITDPTSKLSGFIRADVVNIIK